MKILAPLAVCFALAAPMAQAIVVDFNSDPAPGQGAGSYSSGGLTFTEGGFVGLGIWDGSSPNSNGTNNLIFTDGFGGGNVTITRTGGGTFDLFSIDLVVSWYSGLANDTVLLNGVPQDITSTLTTYVLNLTGITSFTISGLINDANAGYWSADNIVYDVVAPIPVPAALPLMLVALGGLGLVARRRQA